MSEVCDNEDCKGEEVGPLMSGRERGGKNEGENGVGTVSESEMSPKGARDESKAAFKGTNRLAKGCGE